MRRRRIRTERKLFISKGGREREEERREKEGRGVGCLHVVGQEGETNKVRVIGVDERQLRLDGLPHSCAGYLQFFLHEAVALT